MSRGKMVIRLYAVQQVFDDGWVVADEGVHTTAIAAHVHMKEWLRGFPETVLRVISWNESIDVLYIDTSPGERIEDATTISWWAEHDALELAYMELRQ